MIVSLVLLSLAFQPDRAMLRAVFEKALAERVAEFGRDDKRTGQAARDLGLFLQRSGDKVGARKALGEAVRIDEVTLGRGAPETLEDVASLAAVSGPLQAELLLKRVAEAADPVVAGPALSELAGLRRAAGDHAGAAGYYRRAIEKAEAVEGKGGQIGGMLRQALEMEMRVLGRGGAGKPESR